MAPSSMARIVAYPSEPVAFFKQIMQAVISAAPHALQYMNLATIDDEFGVLNRSVLYRGFSDDDCLVYVTQRFTRNYQNLKANAKCGVTFFFPHAQLPTQGDTPLTWQVRLIGAQAVELPEAELDAWWAKEQLPAQIRDSIFPCGQPIDYDELKSKHDQFLNKHLENCEPLPRPSTYTAFKFHAQRWDFTKVGLNEIADRLQYRREDDCKWDVMHVSA